MRMQRGGKAGSSPPPAPESGAASPKHLVGYSWSQLEVWGCPQGSGWSAMGLWGPQTQRALSLQGPTGPGHPRGDSSQAPPFQPHCS